MTASAAAATNIDSLWQVWNNHSLADSSRVKAINKLNSKLVKSKPDSVLIYAKWQLDLATKMEDSYAKRQSYYYFGRAMKYKGHADLAMENFLRGLEISIAAKDEAGANDLRIQIGTTATALGQYDKALEYFFTTFDYHEKVGDLEKVAQILNNFGLIYNHLGEHDQAMSEYRKALLINVKLDDKRSIANNYNNIAGIHFSKGQLDSTIYFGNKCIDVWQTLGDEVGEARITDNIGELYVRLGKYDLAEKYLDRSLALYRKNNNTVGIARASVKKATLLIALNQNLAAIEMLKEALTVVLDNRNTIMIRRTVQRLYVNYNKLNMHEEALAMQELHAAWSDTVRNANNQEEFVRLTFQHNYEKKHLADSIKTAELFTMQNAEIKKEKALGRHDEMAAQKQRQTSYILFGGIFLALLFGAFVFNRYRVIRVQKIIIESQKDEILEGINYSQKIQQALLPSNDKLAAAVKNPLIYYRPKDIVSGDFYWYRETEQFVLIACVDCTGHGVPGGFMSTIGSLLLDKVTEYAAYSPNAILSDLSDEVIRVLHQQTGGAMQDGMDMSVCLIDRKNNTVEFSGARNGITIVNREGATRYKASLLPVGGNYMKKGKPIERKFKSQTIQLEENDWVYMYTDGYEEQLGGKEGLPMNHSQFEKQLMALSEKQDKAAKIQLLDQQLDNWRGDHSRNDDVLILGFQVTEI